jgi:glycerophosphoryl diester phosphodiesterase
MVKIVAHRGAQKHARENTVKSFLAAVALGVDMVELDVRRSGDGVPLVFHDPWLSRKTRRPLLADITYKEINKRAAKKKFSVPTLDEALAALAGKTMLNIELKEPGYELEVLQCAQANFPFDKFIMTSFNPEIIAAIKAADPKVTTGLILAPNSVLTECPTTAADVLAPDLRLFEEKRGVFADAHKKGKRIAVWTVDSAAGISRLLVDPLVDAIITNQPERALALRHKLSNQQ